MGAPKFQWGMSMMALKVQQPTLLSVPITQLMFPQNNALFAFQYIDGLGDITELSAQQEAPFTIFLHP